MFYNLTRMEHGESDHNDDDDFCWSHKVGYKKQTNISTHRFKRNRRLIHLMQDTDVPFFFLLSPEKKIMSGLCTAIWVGVVALLFWNYTWLPPPPPNKEVISEAELDLVSGSLVERYFWDQMRGLNQVMQNQSVLMERNDLALGIMLHHQSLHPDKKTEQILSEYLDTLTQIQKAVSKHISYLSAPRDESAQSWEMPCGACISSDMCKTNKEN